MITYSLAMGIASASQFLALLDEDDAKLKVRALEKLNGLVDQFWAEISESLPKM